MIGFCAKKKAKKYKTLLTKLLAITQEQRDLIIGEYYKMCKTHFFMKTRVYNLWQESQNILLIKDLYTSDDNFVSKAQKINISLKNLFAGTSYEKVIGNLTVKNDLEYHCRKAEGE